MHRSSSVSVLDQVYFNIFKCYYCTNETYYLCKNQSDSESDPNQSTDVGIKNTGIIRAMRPTISSQNKIITNKSNLLRRKSSNASQSTSIYFVFTIISKF